MLLVLGIFILGNIISIFTSNFNVLLIARVIPAFFHPVYCSLALTVAATSVSKEEAPKAVSKGHVRCDRRYGSWCTIVIGGVLFLAMSLLTNFLRIYFFNPAKQ